MIEKLQGSSLSPALFNVFINRFITELNLLGHGCSVNKTWLGCVLYADDIILLSSSIGGLQAMLDRCYNVSLDLRLIFNPNKSHCIVFGPLFKENLLVMFIGEGASQWVNCIKYLSKVKSFPSHKAHRAALISVSIALSQTSANAARPRILG
jgi:hypothetical protein